MEWNWKNSLLHQDFLPPFSHTSLFYLCSPRDGVAIIFTAIPHFYLFCNKFPGLQKAIGREGVHAAGVPVRMEALIIFSELKKSCVMSRFEPLPPVWKASALSIALCPSANYIKINFYLVGRRLSTTSASFLTLRRHDGDVVLCFTERRFSVDQIRIFSTFSPGPIF